MATCLLDLSTEGELFATVEPESPEVPPHCTESDKSCPGDYEGSCNTAPAPAVSTGSNTSVLPASEFATNLATFHRRLNDAKNELAEASIAFAGIDRAHKSAKKRCKAAVEQIEEISKDTSVGPGLSFAFAHVGEWRNNPEPIASVTDAPAVTSATPAPEATEQPDNNAWRAVPIADLQLSGIKGLGVKILAAIADQCPTVGQLEDLRAQGSGKGIGLRSIPRLGEEKAQAIEDRLLDWLTKNRDAHLFQAAQRVEQIEQSSELAGGAPLASEAEPEPEVTAREPSAGRPAGEAAKPTLADVDPASLADPKGRAAAISLRITQLNTGEEGCLDCHQSTTAHKEGDDDFWNGLDPVDVPYTIGSPQGDDWLRGWLKGQLDQMESIESETENESEITEAAGIGQGGEG